MFAFAQHSCDSKQKVGALFGSALARQGARVAVVCRSDYDAVSRDGYDIRSPVFGNHRFRPDHVYRNVADCREPPDYLLLTSKVLENLEVKIESDGEICVRGASIMKGYFTTLF